MFRMLEDVSNCSLSGKKCLQMGDSSTEVITAEDDFDAWFPTYRWYLALPYPENLEDVWLTFTCKFGTNIVSRKTLRKTVEILVFEHVRRSLRGFMQPWLTMYLIWSSVPSEIALDMTQAVSFFISKSTFTNKDTSWGIMFASIIIRIWSFLPTYSKQGLAICHHCLVEAPLNLHLQSHLVEVSDLEA